MCLKAPEKGKKPYYVNFVNFKFLDLLAVPTQSFLDLLAVPTQSFEGILLVFTVWEPESPPL